MTTSRRAARVLSAAAVLALALLSAAPAARPTVEEARRFVDQANERLLELNNRLQRAQWVAATYITDDTEKISSEYNEQSIAATTALALEARRFDGMTLPPDVARSLKLLKLALTLPAPNNPKERAELTEIAAWLEGTYGKGKWCPQGPDKDCLDINGVSKILAESRDPKELLDAWKGWHAVGKPMRPKYQRFVTLSNQGAKELGFADTGAMWRSNYDMEQAQFAAEVDRLWNQVRPLYESLHAYVRWKLSEKYGPAVVPPTGPMPAHVLGNLWAQTWEYTYPLVAPPQADPGYNVTAILQARQADPQGMVRYGEGFFSSLGLEPMPPTFWVRSMFVKPPDHDVVCHASAWDVDNDQDLRIKMCIEINDEDFKTIHHELGHNYYQRAYRQQPFLFRDSANDGFHEALGDTVALSITPSYLKQLGFIDKDPAPGSDTGLLLRMALDKVAFLPFGLVIDQWRWKVFSGEVKPSDYNAAWWELRRKYQGVAEPLPRSEADFDPGAKYHVPANVPYTRYFLADILQFQFHRGLCRIAGQKGPLHRCSIYGNKAAGEALA
ncbi:MAG TPA: M2 family metallopeptidase, partial [Candidatus Polarisedimenticolia bacterium]|nr:M2 family metallopeptidase [Candidatus Polarisedimenticolia bacterium]